MELVYLWVEDYKNIHKQGFNFSPRFSCEYDDIKKELTIKENDDYIENFFGKNINVTAIVGKNGSGKSNIFEAILTLFSEIKDDANHNYKTFIIFFEKDNLFIKIIDYDEVKTILNNRKVDNILLDNVVYNIYFNYTLDYLMNDSTNFNKLYQKVDGYSTPILLEPNKSKGYIDISLLEYLQNRNILKFKLKDRKDIKKLTNIFNPIFCKLKRNDDKLFFAGKDNYGYQKRQKENNYKYLEEIESKLITNDPTLEKEINRNDLSLLNKLYILKKIYPALNSQESIGLNSDFYDWYKKLGSKEKTKQVIEYFDDNIIKKLITKNQKKLEILKILDAIEFHKNIPNKLKVNQKINIEDNLELLNKLPPWIDIEFINENDISLNQLSYGEKTSIRLYYTILNHIQNIIKHTDSKYTLFNIFFDEVEQGFHPNWQKEFINEIIKLLTSFYSENKFHFFFSSHSPFILSDLPKQNIIFLDKDEKGNCKVVDGLKEKKQTFGANIHTLLSDSFFMEDGLMGEFAKGKIDEVIKFLNKEKLDKKELKYCEQIISIVGEPIVKNQLQRMLDSKRLKKVDEIDAIKQSMIAMQKRLDELEK